MVTTFILQKLAKKTPVASSIIKRNEILSFATKRIELNGRHHIKSSKPDTES